MDFPLKSMGCILQTDFDAELDMDSALNPSPIPLQEQLCEPTLRICSYNVFYVELDADSASKSDYNPFEWEIHIMNYATDFFSHEKKKKKGLIPNRTAEALISPT